MLSSLQNSRFFFIFTALIVHATASTISIRIPVAPRDHGTCEFSEDWHCFNLLLLPQRMGSDNRAHNHLFLIAKAQKIGLLQVVVCDEDACYRNDNWSNPSFLIPSSYCHYFHTLLIPSKNSHFPGNQLPVTFPRNQTIKLNLSSFSILINYLISTHMFRNKPIEFTGTSNKEVMHSAS